MTGDPGPRSFDGAAALVAAANRLFQRGIKQDGRRDAAKRGAAARAEFDASISLHDGHLRDAGLGEGRAAEAVRVVRAAVGSMRGAGWIDVEYLGPWCGARWAWVSRAEWLTLHRRGDAAWPSVRGWDRLREGVEETVALALAEVARR